MGAVVSIITQSAEAARLAAGVSLYNRLIHGQSTDRQALDPTLTTAGGSLFPSFPTTRSGRSDRCGMHDVRTSVIVPRLDLPLASRHVLTEKWRLHTIHA